MKEETKEAIKLFGREDLLSDYGIQDTDTNIEVFLSVKDMIKYYKQCKEIERLNNIIDKAIEYIDWQRRNPQYDNVWRNAECEDLIEILRGDKE